MTTVCRPADWSSSSGESKWGSEVASPTMVPTRFPPRAATSRCISDDEASAHPSSDSSKRYATSSLEPPTISNLAVFAACCRSARTNMATASMIATRIRARRLATGGDYETTGTNMRRSPKTQGIFCVAVFRHLLCLLPSFFSRTVGKVADNMGTNTDWVSVTNASSVTCTPPGRGRPLEASSTQGCISTYVFS